MSNRLSGPLPDPAGDAGYPDGHPPRMGFFTDTSVCIGCKACEVACKEWNLVPEDGINLLGQSYDNTGELSANTWRHVAFVEQRVPAESRRQQAADHSTVDYSTVDVLAAVDVSNSAASAAVDVGMPTMGAPRQDATGERDGVRWLMSSDVCKHCTHAACLDVCPTGALFRTEFGTVVVQDDICNGCGYCIPTCPYGVIGKRKEDGRAFKCTLCYDRIGDGLKPACATACPTESIQYGELDELRERAATRLATLHQQGVSEARLYGESPDDGVGGDGAFFLLLDEPEVYGLPPDPVVTTRDLPSMWRRAGAAALTVAATVAVSFLGGR